MSQENDVTVFEGNNELSDADMTDNEVAGSNSNANSKEDQGDSVVVESKQKFAVPEKFASDKYAIIKEKGKQFIVREGVRIVTDRINVEEGQAVSFDDVLLVSGVENGKTVVRKGEAALASSISGTVVEHKRGKKIVSYKKKRRHGYERKVGHRSDLSVVLIDKIA